MADTNPGFAAHMMAAIYVERTAHLEPISLVCLPAGATVYGGGGFFTRIEGGWLSDQYLPDAGVSGADLDELARSKRPIIEVSGENLLVARYGMTTWGHWLAELFPKIALVEATFPGRFRFVLPPEMTQAPPDSVWLRLQETMRSLGIPPSRICPIIPKCDFRFARLFALTSVWSDGIMHPAATAALRAAMATVPPGRARKIAVQREPSSGRAISNAAEVYAAVQRHGYSSHMTGRLTFLDQVSLFKGADTVFGVLGSDLTNLIFSPEGVGMVSVAPDHFGDRFFYALVLDRGGTTFDIRGPETAAHWVPHKATFSIDTRYLETALSSIEAAV